MAGDSSALHHRLCSPLVITDSALLVALFYESFSLSSASRPVHFPRGRRESLCTGVSVKIKNVSDADSNPYGFLLHGSAAEGCRNVASPPQATRRKLR